MRVLRAFPLHWLGLLAAVTVTAGAQNARQTGVQPVIPGSGPLKGQTLYTNSHALVVGINAYPHLRPEDQLECAENDAVRLREVLIRSYGFPPQNITLLLSARATKTAIQSGLNSLAEPARVKPGDRVLVYFSGHGKDVRLTKDSRMGFLLPTDARVGLEEPNPAEYLRTCVRMDEVQGMLRLTPAKHALVIADACFSGLLVGSKLVDDEGAGASAASAVRGWSVRPAKQILTAGGKDEKAKEDRERGYGLFTFKLLEELTARAANADRAFPVLDLWVRLKPSVSGLSGGQQVPQFSQQDGTDGQFLLLPTSPRPVPVLHGLTPFGGARTARIPALPERPKRNDASLPQGKVGTVMLVQPRGWVNVTSTPPGARIFQDGVDTGQVTPARVPVELGLEDRRQVGIALRHARRREAFRRVEIARGAVVPLDVQLEEGESPLEPPRRQAPSRQTKDGAELVWIPPGEFEMGASTAEPGEADERPVHPVRIRRGFWLYRTEVTNAMYRRFVQEVGHPQPLFWRDRRFNQDQQPVVGVTWEDAASYCKWVGGRLPTEAEWEYAARGRDGRRYPWGDTAPSPYLVTSGLPSTTGVPEAVGSHPAGASWRGALDLAGGVCEWCSDWYDPGYYGVSPDVDPRGPSQGTHRVLRGGSWFYLPANLRSNRRDHNDPRTQLSVNGFRPVVPGPGK